MKHRLHAGTYTPLRAEYFCWCTCRPLTVGQNICIGFALVTAFGKLASNFPWSPQPLRALPQQLPFTGHPLSIVGHSVPCPHISQNSGSGPLIRLAHIFSYSSVGASSSSSSASRPSGSDSLSLSGIVGALNQQGQWSRVKTIA